MYILNNAAEMHLLQPLNFSPDGYIKNLLAPILCKTKQAMVSHFLCLFTAAKPIRLQREVCHCETKENTTKKKTQATIRVTLNYFKKVTMNKTRSLVSAWRRFQRSEEAEDGTLSERKLEATLKMKRSHLLDLMGKLENNKTGNRKRWRRKTSHCYSAHT